MCKGTSRFVTLVATAVLLASVFACGDSPKGTSPMAPSSAPSGSTGSATIVGLVNGVRTGMMVAAEDSGLSSAVDTGGHFQLGGVPAGNVLLHFTASGVDARTTIPQVANQQRVNVTIAVSATTATVLSDSRDADDSMAEVEGTIAGKGGTCPSISFTLGSTMVRTNAQTRFSGGACSDAANGLKAEVSGTRQTDGSVTAASVQLERPEVEPVEIKGPVSGLSGACPSLMFTVASTVVRTSAQTRFSDGTCANVANGKMVEVEGMRQADGSLTAQTVSLEGENENEGVELEGTVSSVNVQAHTFVVSGKTVMVTAQTEIRHGSTVLQFSSIVMGVRVHVKGTAGASGVVTATMIEVQNDNPTPPEEVNEVSGTVSGVTAACPSVKFTVKGRLVTTSPLTTYAGGTCGDIKAGATVEVRGLLQPDSSLAASSVKFEKEDGGDK